MECMCYTTTLSFSIGENESESEHLEWQKGQRKSPNS